MSTLTYFDAMEKSMTWMSKQKDVYFVGQAVGVPGTFMFNTLKEVPGDLRLELPVNESFQMQFSLGIAISGFTVVSIYPRLNFLTLALGDMSNMLDRIGDMSSMKHPPRVIVRSAVGPSAPVHPGHQHIGDFTEAFKKLFNHIEVIRIDEPEQALPAYQKAYQDKTKSYLLIEVGNNYAGK
jgi:pyruvate/2-oxoglutarate/acetoin dehydrogenase E1 component